MVVLAVVPLAALLALALVASGVAPARLAQGWSPETRRVALAGILGAGLVLYLYHGTHCVAVSPDGRYRATLRYNGLLFQAGLEDAVVVVEGMGREGAYVAARERLPRAFGRPERLAWHPDSRLVACIQAGKGGHPRCSVLRVMPRLASLQRQRPGIAGP